MSSKIGYKIVPNATPTKDAAPYLGIAIPRGSLAYDNILQRMVANGTHMTAATARYLLAALYELAAETIAEEVVRISLGPVSLFPNISGGFDSEDAEFDPARNRLFIDAALSKSLQDEVAGLIPAYAGEADGASSVKIHSAYDPETKLFGVISGKNAFRLAGVDLTVPDADDESLELWDASLSAKVSDLTVASTDGGQQITVSITGTTDVPKGKYRVRLKSHGLDPTAKLTTTSLPVTVAVAVQGESVPAPEVTNVTDSPDTDNVCRKPYTASTTITGTGLAAATVENMKVYAQDANEEYTVEMTLKNMDESQRTDTQLVFPNGLIVDGENPPGFGAKLILTTPGGRCEHYFDLEF